MWSSSKTYLQGLHESFGARFGYGTQVVDEISFGHSNTSVNDGQSLLLLVGDETDVEVFAAVQTAGICETLITDLIQGLIKEKKQRFYFQSYSNIDVFSNALTILWTSL